MIMITILNIQTDKFKLCGSYGFVILTSIIAYIQIFRFWRQTSIWGEKNFEKGLDMYFSELKNYVVLIKGIPETIDPIKGSLEIKRILTRPQPSSTQNEQFSYQNQLVDFKIVGENYEVNKLG